MIRKFNIEDLDAVMDIWLTTNISSHDFIEEKYWHENFSMVREMIPLASVHVYELKGEVVGFMGVIQDEVAGIFIKDAHQSRGAGKGLLDQVKADRSLLSLKVYAKNVRALDFYLREGFGICSEQVDLMTGEPEYVMQWMKHPMQ